MSNSTFKDLYDNYVRSCRYSGEHRAHIAEHFFDLGISSQWTLVENELPPLGEEVIWKDTEGHNSLWYLDPEWTKSMCDIALKGTDGTPSRVKWMHIPK